MAALMQSGFLYKLADTKTQNMHALAEGVNSILNENPILRIEIYLILWQPLDKVCTVEIHRLDQ